MFNGYYYDVTEEKKSKDARQPKVELAEKSTQGQTNKTTDTKGSNLFSMITQNQNDSKKKKSNRTKKSSNVYIDKSYTDKNQKSEESTRRDPVQQYKSQLLLKSLHQILDEDAQSTQQMKYEPEKKEEIF